MGQKKFMALKFIETMPDGSTLFFRDGVHPSRSLDFVLMALLLENWHSGIRGLDIFKNASGGSACLLADKSGAWHHPVTGGAVPADGLVLREGLKKQTIRSYIGKGFYFFRKNIMRESYGDRTIKINGSIIFSEGLSVPENLAALNDSIKWKLSGHDDISDNIEKHIGLKALMADGSENRALHDAVCPADGYVKTISADFISPGWTWNAWCGRHFKAVLCPHCLGVFYSHLSAMS